MTDLAVRGGRVVAGGEVREVDVLVHEGRIARIVAPGEGRVDDEIDARGLVVLPGVVDAHVHFNEPGRADWEGWESGTRSAAAGGITTVADMPLNSIPPTLDGAALAAKHAVASRLALVDFALWGGLVGVDAAPIRELHDGGAAGVKAFLCDSGVPEFAALPLELLAPALAAAARSGLVVAVHAEDEATIARATAAARRAGRDRAAWLASRPAEAERVAVRRVAAASRATGARVHVVHLSAADALDDAAGLSVETCPHYLLFDDGDVARVGPALKCAPPIRDAANRERLWAAVKDGRIGIVASDHSPCAPALKERGADDIFAAWGGVAGVQSLLPALLTEGVHRRGLPLPRLAELVAEAPARLLGLARKGRIAPGMDADLALVDLDAEWTLDASAISTRGTSPYAGRRFRGKVVATVVRGRTVYRDGSFLVRPGSGEFVAREVAVHA